MNIHADRIESSPPHALNIRQVRLILEAVPVEWIEGLSEVHLSNSTESGPRVFFNRYYHKLTIHSRGCSPAHALEMVLSELAAVHLGLTTRHWHRLSKAEMGHIKPVIQPLLNKLISFATPQEKHEPMLTPTFRRVI
jgi:hypothetical protein